MLSADELEGDLVEDKALENIRVEIIEDEVAETETYLVTVDAAIADACFEAVVVETVGTNVLQSLVD